MRADRIKKKSSRYHSHPVTPQAKARRGLSLLEVVLALSILAVTAALLAQITRQATDNALMTQRIASAQIICEATMAEVLVGTLPMEPIGWTPIDGSFSRGSWYYKLETVPAERPNMVGLRLAVTDMADAEASSELFFLVRWVIDPTLGLDSPPQPSATGTASGTSSSGTAGSTRSGSFGGGIQ